jgi:ABC-2 type transport system ATP-binding protein
MSEWVLELSGVRKVFGAFVAVDEVTMRLGRGQVLGFLGPNGAGKTTTVKMLTGLIKPTEGTASIAGFDVGSEPLEVKKRIGYVPESGALYQSLTPFEYLGFVGRLYGMEAGEAAQKIGEICRFFRLEDRMHGRMSEFSRGMRQKVVIASALIHDPQVIFLDEPLSGLDANTALMLKELIRNLADEGKTIFYCSHILEVVENLCERVVIINNGRVVADGSVGELKEMTKKRSLEAVFNQLTVDEDLVELVRAFSKKMAASGKGRKA